MHLCKQNDEFMWQQMYTPINVENCRMRKKEWIYLVIFCFILTWAAVNNLKIIHKITKKFPDCKIHGLCG